MKKLRTIIVLIALFNGFTVAWAQQGFGTSDPNKDAVIELKSINKGLLMPRLALTGTTAASPLSAHVAGMVVYNTATAGDVTPGIYYNDGAKWLKAVTTTGLDDTNDAWINDNANTQLKLATLSDGTTARTNATQVVIKDNGNVGIGTTTPGDRLHVETTATSNFLGVVNFFAPANTTLGNASMLRLGTAGSTKNTAELRYVHNTSGGNLNRLDISFSGVGSAPLSVLAGGNVGIGETAPSAKLEVNGNVEISTVNAVPNDQVYKPLVLNTTTNRVETTTANATHINKSISAAAGATATVYPLVVSGAGAFDVKVFVTNDCGASSYNRFVIAGSSNANSTGDYWSLNHIGGTSQNGASTVDASSTRNSKFIHNPLSGGCGDGSNTTALDYTLTVDMTGVLSVTNNGNISRTYFITIEKAFD